MVPRILLLIAFVIISCKCFKIIHIEIFKKELCNDDFYTGGIQKSTNKRTNTQRKVSKRSVPQTNRPVARKHTSSYSSNMSSTSYNSYEAYKKSVSSK